MSPRLDHLGIEQLLGAYALDALETDERLSVEEHLLECPRCRAEVDAHIEVAAALANTSAEAPPELWDRIHASLGAEWETPGSAAVSSEAGGGPDDLPPALRRRLRPVAGGRGSGGERHRKSPRRRLGALAAAAAVVVTAGLAVVLTQVEGQSGHPGGAPLAQGLEQGARWALAQPDHETAPLRTTSDHQVAQVVVAGGHGYLVSDRLGPLPQGRTYQLWGLIGGRPISLGLLGRAPGAAAFSLGAARPSAVMVTVEPAAGVSTPGRPLAQGTLS